MLPRVSSEHPGYPCKLRCSTSLFVYVDEQGHGHNLKSNETQIELSKALNMTATLFATADSLLIQLYRITGYVYADYFLGTFLLSFIAVVLGEWTISWVFRLNRHHILNLEKELSQSHELSMLALEESDSKTYQVCNKQANDVFGRYFFNQVAFSAAILWPVPLILAWMQSRFLHVEFPFAYPVSLIWSSTGYFTTFILCYILSRILFKNMRPYLPYFRNVQKTLDAIHAQEIAEKA